MVFWSCLAEEQKIQDDCEEQSASQHPREDGRFEEVSDASHMSMWLVNECHHYSIHLSEYLATLHIKFQFERKMVRDDVL